MYPVHVPDLPMYAVKPVLNLSHTWSFTAREVAKATGLSAAQVLHILKKHPAERRGERAERRSRMA
jgi:hypothetical protein